MDAQARVVLMAALALMAGGGRGATALPCGAGAAPRADRATMVRSRVPRDRAPIDAHRKVVYDFAVTNDCATPQTIATIRTSCACLKVGRDGVPSPSAVAGGTATLPCGVRRADRIAPGAAIPLRVTFDPTGMEGPVTKSVSVELAPSGKIVRFAFNENVRLRCGLKPSDAAFGVVRSAGRSAGWSAGRSAGRSVVERRPYRDVCRMDVRLSGYAVTNGTAKIVALVPPTNPQFDVLVNADGLGLTVGGDPRAPRDATVRSRVPRDRRSGTFAETWIVKTNDPEIPEIPFVVSAQFVDGLSVMPRVLTIETNGRDGVPSPSAGGASSVAGGTATPTGAAVAGGTAALPNRIVTLRRDDRRPFKILSAETMPRKWGDVNIAAQPLNGWRVNITGIDPNEVRQFSKHPYLRLTTDINDLKAIDIPLRITNGRDGVPSPSAVAGGTAPLPCGVRGAPAPPNGTFADRPQPTVRSRVPRDRDATVGSRVPRDRDAMVGSRVPRDRDAMVGSRVPRDRKDLTSEGGSK